MPSYRSLNVNHHTPNLTEAGFYGDIMFDADDTAPTYIGLNTTNGASTSTNTDWKIYKFTYGTGTAITRIQLAYGAWDNRASLF